VAEISAGRVRELRERTGGGMMDCKRALEEAGGDLDTAARLLREKGIAKADKKAGRTTSEGRIAALVSSDRRTGALVELCSETDFVAKTDEFGAFATELARLVAERAPADVPALLALSTPEGPVEQRLKALIGKLGENMLVRRIARLAGDGAGLVSSYVHAGGKIGVLVQVKGDASKPALGELAHKVCMHVAAMAPRSLSRQDLPADQIELERQVLRKQSEAEGKPANIIDKMVEGRLSKFFKEVVLLEQALVMDPDVAVGKAAQAAGAEIVAFRRLQLGAD
jgi:elongation factor Ts